MVVMLFYFISYTYQIHTFKDSPNDEEMLISHLIKCVHYIIKNLFHDKNNIKQFEKKEQ